MFACRRYRVRDWVAGEHRQQSRRPSESNSMRIRSELLAHLTLPGA